jgi:hypothetical protein
LRGSAKAEQEVSWFLLNARSWDHHSARSLQRGIGTERLASPRRVSRQRLLAVRRFLDPLPQTGRATFTASGFPSVDPAQHAERPAPFTGIPGTSSRLASRYLSTGLLDRLPPFALWPAFPTADYYDGSDARSPLRLTANLGIGQRASHVPEDGLYAGV